MEDLVVELRVQLAVLPKTLLRAFAGTSVRKARSFILVDELLKDLVDRLNRTNHFHRSDGVSASINDLHAVIRAAVLEIDDETIAGLASGKEREVRDRCNSIAAAKINDALFEVFTVTKKQMNMYR